VEVEGVAIPEGSIEGAEGAEIGSKII